MTKSIHHCWSFVVRVSVISRLWTRSTSRRQNGHRLALAVSFELPKLSDSNLKRSDKPCENNFLASPTQLISECVSEWLPGFRQCLFFGRIWIQNINPAIHCILSFTLVRRDADWTLAHLFPFCPLLLSRESAEKVQNMQVRSIRKTPSDCLVEALGCVR